MRVAAHDPVIPISMFMQRAREEIFLFVNVRIYFAWMVGVMYLICVRTNVNYFVIYQNIFVRSICVFIVHVTHGNSYYKFPTVE